MVTLPRNGSRELPGVIVHSNGVSGEVLAKARGRDAAERERVEGLKRLLIDRGVPTGGAEALATAASDAALHTTLEISLDRLDVPTARGAAPRGASAQASGLDLEVRKASPGEAQVMLEVDDAGVVAWHVPVHSAPGQPLRGLRSDVFRIPVQPVHVPGREPDDRMGAAGRSLGAFGVRKVLRLFRYPIEAAAGSLGGTLVSRWETAAHPHVLQRVDSAGRMSPLDEADWRNVRGRPTLLFVHGTFSCTQDAFSALLADEALLTELLRRYDNRVLAFDHPTLHLDPVANARRLLEQVPPDVDLCLDIVCHSRGGLVSRALSLTEVAELAQRRTPRVRSLVHVAVPNAGTALADIERWGFLLDSMTNLSILLPTDAVSVPLTAILQTVKHLGTGVVHGLPGLSAMSPGSDVLARLAYAGAAGQHAETQFTLSSNYAPMEAPLPLRALDLLVDRLFREGNDLVVPSAGVAQLPGLDRTAVTELPPVPPVTHVTYFRQRVTRQFICSRLPGASPSDLPSPLTTAHWT